MAILWAGCKDEDSRASPNVTTHNSSSESYPTVAKQESIAEPPSTDLDSVTIDSQSVVSEATKDRDRFESFGSGSHTIGNTDELLISIENCTQELQEAQQRFETGTIRRGIRTLAVAKQHCSVATLRRDHWQCLQL